MTEEKDIIIIGAGLTGLTMAFYLKKKGRSVVVVEKSNHAGGAIRTYRENGYILESGPNTGSLANPEMAELFDHLKECTLETANEDAHRRLIYKDGKLHALPCGLISGLFTPLFTWKDKFGIFFEPFRKRGTDPDESIAKLALRRLGKSYLDYAVDPFVSGIYAGDPNLLTTRYALPKLYALEENYGGFIKGAIAKAKEPKTERDRKANKEVFSAKNGLDNLIKALVSEIGENNILLGNQLLEVSGTVGRWTTKLDNGTISAPVIISTVGSYALPAVFPFTPENLMNRINNLRYAPIVQVSVGISESDVDKNDLHAFGALIPSVEKRKILGVLYPSSCFKDRCPKGKALLSIFLGGMRFPDFISLSDNEIEQLIKTELRAFFRKPDFKPEFIKIFRHSHAIPQYEKNTGERLQAITEFEQTYSGIILAGNLRDGIGMAHRVKQAVNIAESL